MMTHAILRRFSCHLLSMPRLQCLHHFPIECLHHQFLRETASISCSQFASMCLTWKVKLHAPSLPFLPCLSAWLAPSVSLCQCQLPIPAAGDICIHLFVSAFRVYEVLKAQSCSIMFHCLRKTHFTLGVSRLSLEDDMK